VNQLAIPGFEVVEEIGRGAYSVVYRATRGERSFAIKIQRPDTDGHGTASLRFRREAAILACLRDPGLPAILELGQVDGRSYIVQEYVRGRTLSQLITEGPLSEPTIIAIARRIAGAFGEVHRRGMVHRDVKPDNIIINGADGAKLIDFGFAARASSERVRREVAGTLLYSAPEQTGMLKRPLDGRTDLYSLGVVLYECAAGAPPFVHEDTGELVRQHAVARPPDLRKRNPEISPALVAIIEKLLAKDPDDRYQSREGLLGDLDRIDALNKRLTAGEEINLGADDIPVNARVETALEGRASELDQLLVRHGRLPRSGGGVVLIEAETGMGKTRLVKELAARVHTAGGQVMVGHCAAGSPLPFAPLREAVEDLLRHAGRLTGEARGAALARIRDAAGDAAPLLRRLSPRLGALLGVQVEPPGLEEVRDQFYDAAAQFLLRLAALGERGLLVIEDIELVDDATRRVLARLAPRLATSPLLVVATVDRDDAHAPARERFVSEMGSALKARLPLPPLEDTAIRRLVAGQLGDREAQVAVADRIAARSNGSPFAAMEYVRGMLEAGLLTPSWGTWQAEEAGLEGLPLPTDVVELVRRRSRQLSEEARRVLRVAALLGVRFALDHLAEICEVEQEAMQLAIEEGVRARVVEPLEGGACAFVHTEVRDNLVAELGPAEARALHQRIAQVLDRHLDPETDQVFAVARHYALGEVERDPRRLFEASAAAGRRALDEYAHEEAYNYLMEARRCAEANGFELPLDLLDGLGEVCDRTGRLAEAIAHFEAALGGTTDPLQRARLRAKLSHAHVADFHTLPAWEEARRGLQELGRPLPRWPVLQLLTTLWHWVVAWLVDRLGLGFGRSRGARRQKDAIEVRLYEHAALAAYFNSWPGRLLMVVLRAYRPAVRLGRSPELVAAYSQQAVILAVARRFRAARRRSARAIKLAGELDDRLTLARCQLYHGFVIHLCGASVEAEATMQRALDGHGAWADSLHYIDAAGDLVFNLLVRGYLQEAWTWIERMLPRASFTISGVRAIQLNPWAGPVLAALGRTSEGVRFQQQMRDFCERAPRGERYMWGEMLSHRLLFALEQGERGDALDPIIAGHRELGLTPRWTSFHMRGFFIYRAYARLEQAMAGTSAERIAQVARASVELDRAVMIPSMRAHALVIKGALRRLEGRPRLAQRLFDGAENLARAVDSPWVRFEVARQRAHLLRDEGGQVPAAREARVALGLALDHGWAQRARKIRAEFDVGDTSTRSLEPSPLRSSRPTSSTASLRLKRQLDALLQVSLASARVLDPDHQARLALDEVVRILGAERGFLFLAGEEGGLEFLAGRDAEGADLERPTGFSTTVTELAQERGEPVVVSGSEQGAVLGSQSVVTHDLRSIVAAPLKLQDRSVGVLYLDNRLARGVFTEEDVEILLAIGSHIAIALETGRAAQLEISVEAERRKRELAESLRDMSHALSSSLDLDEVLSRLLDGVTAIIPCDRAAVFLADEQGYLLAVERAQRRRGELRLSRGDCPLLDEVVGQRVPFVVPDTTRERRIDHQRLERYLHTWIGVPLITHDRVAGALTLERAVGTYTAEDADIAYAFAGQAGIAIENARLFGEVQRMAVIDSLTGILNRRHFFELAEREVKRARRSGRPLCAIMADVDHFKRVNDDHGHLVGDQVLEEIARRCKESIRGEDLLGRFGGEEFVLLLPEAPLEVAAANVAERLRREVAGVPIATNRGELKLTISLGVAELGPGEDLAALLERADGALYAAKQGGRDRVERAAAPAETGGQR